MRSVETRSLAGDNGRGTVCFTPTKGARCEGCAAKGCLKEGFKRNPPKYLKKMMDAGPKETKGKKRKKKNGGSECPANGKMTKSKQQFTLAGGGKGFGRAEPGEALLCLQGEPVMASEGQSAGTEKKKKGRGCRGRVPNAGPCAVFQKPRSCGKRPAPLVAVILVALAVEEEISKFCFPLSPLLLSSDAADAVPVIFLINIFPSPCPFCAHCTFLI